MRPFRNRREQEPGPGHGATWSTPPINWWRELGFEGGPPRTLRAVEDRYRRLVATAHPDRGGSVDAMQRLNRARAQARRCLSV